jgi:hypothetical protein
VWVIQQWLQTTDAQRYHDMHIAFLQFEDNPGSEGFVAEEIRDLRALLGEQQGTERWNDDIAHLLAKLDKAAQDHTIG